MICLEQKNSSTFVCGKDFLIINLAGGSDLSPTRLVGINANLIFVDYAYLKKFCFKVHPNSILHEIILPCVKNKLGKVYVEGVLFLEGDYLAKT